MERHLALRRGDSYGLADEFPVRKEAEQCQASFFIHSDCQTAPAAGAWRSSAGTEGICILQPNAE